MLSFAEDAKKQQTACLPVCSLDPRRLVVTFFLFCTALRVLLRTLACGWNDQEGLGLHPRLLQAEKSPFAGKQLRAILQGGELAAVCVALRAAKRKQH